MRKSYSGNAVATTLGGGISPTAMTLNVGATTGWPDTTTGPFVITIDRGQGSLEEKVLISSFSGATLTVETRGWDGTTAQSHSSGASVVHTLDADTINEANDIVNGVGSVTPSTSAVGDSAVDGTSIFPAAADHKHARESFASGATAASAPGDTRNDGSSVSPARADHKHARESVASLVADVSPSVLGLPMDLTGATAATRYVGGTTSGAPTSGSFAVGDYVVDQTGLIWVCTGAGSPGTWKLPYPALTSSAGHLGSAYNITTSQATYLTTASLGVGTWLVNHKAEHRGSGENLDVLVGIGTATATFEGACSGASAVSGGAGVYASIALAFIATVTVAGTLVFQAIGTANTGTIHNVSSDHSYFNATGYTAVRID